MNNTLKNVLTSALVAVVVSVGLGLVSNQSAQIDYDKIAAIMNEKLGAAVTGFNRSPNSSVNARCFNTNTTSTTNCNDWSVNAKSLSVGPGATLTVLTSTYQMTAADICDNGVVYFNYGVVSSSITTPSSSAFTSYCLQSVGQYKDVLFVNTTTTGRTVVYGGASTTILGIATSSAQTTGSSTSITANGSALIRFIYSSAAAGEVEAHMLTNGN